MRKFKGAEIVNSAKNLRIDIEHKDIEAGKPLDPENCAAAECIKRTLGVDDVAVHRHVTIIKTGKLARKYKTSSALRMETIIFDRGGRFMPGEYDLKPVPLSAITQRVRRTPSQPRKGQTAKLSRRRMSIPGVRKRANYNEDQEN